jgi:hypothetical protein
MAPPEHKWRAKLVATLAMPHVLVESRRQEAISSARQRLSTARHDLEIANNETRWWAKVRDEAIIEAWEAGAKRQDIVDASKSRKSVPSRINVCTRRKRTCGPQGSET